MKKLFALILTLSMLLAFAGCSAENKNNTPPAENDSVAQPEGNGGKDPAPEEKDEPAVQPEQPSGNALTDAELAAWENYFREMENNGLLRFPYADLAENPDQLAPYLIWLFYDIGDNRSEISDTEIALLKEEGMWLETDVFRLRRDFMTGYLQSHLNIPAADTENLLDAAKLGVYLMEYDAWYTEHGDTEYSFYEFDHGTVFEDGRIMLWYFNNFLRVVQDNGEMEYVSAEMIITLVPREDGSFYIVSHEISSDLYGE